MVDPLNIIRLKALTEFTSVRPEITIGLIDGPVNMFHPDLTIENICEIAGATDEHRALNYLVRYDAIYIKATEMHQRNFALTEVIVGTSRLSGTRKIVAPTFSFTNRETGFMDKYFVRVDVTEEFPFQVTPLSPYYDR